MSEFTYIENYFTPLATAPEALGLTDDAAIIPSLAGEEMVITTDAICEGVHFRRDTAPDLIARKLLRTNLSDIAAMGAVPYGYLLCLMLPEEAQEKWVAEFTQGLKEDAARFAIALFGGDTTRTHDSLTLSLTALGTVPKGKAVKRSTAKVGDRIYVTGTLGDAALGLRLLESNDPQTIYKSLVDRYHLPEPRLEAALHLREFATSMMDISDGLVQDMEHIAKASGVGAVLYADSVPLSDAARAVIKANNKWQELPFNGGDDYELLFTASPAVEAEIYAVAEKTSLPITLIGEVREGKGVKLLDGNGNAMFLARAGYQHF